MHKTKSLAIALALSLSAFFPAIPSAAVSADTAKAAVADTAKRTSAVPSADTSKSPASPTGVQVPAAVVPPRADSAVAVPSPSPAPAPSVSAPAVAAADSAARDTASADSTKSMRPKKRNRIVRETTVNSIDELKGRYRSPKKAMFMSLLVPGLGQAYVGHSWINYTRGAVYFMADVALAYGWHYYVVDRQDHQIAKYQRFADENWRQTRYENYIFDKNTPFNKDRFSVVNPHRQSYCDAVQNRNPGFSTTLYAGCIEPDPNSQNYRSFRGEYNDDAWTGTDTIAHRRSEFVNPQAFYELIGKNVEFIKGWSDAGNVELGDSTFHLEDSTHTPIKDANGKLVPATTKQQQQYVNMRAKANDYARMQAYFLGGMVVNHLVSALDAALTAHYHNKALYQTEVRWWDRVHVDGGLAWQGLEPTTAVTARVTF